MTPEEWHRVRPILESALELDSGNRRAFLNEACADPSLRREVESLIDAHEQAETWDLNSLSVLGLGVEEGARFRLLPSRRVGPYEILEELALGGMGAVYRAVRADGEYKQQVALKIVRADFGADSTAKRFRNERQILASLDHHNIAKILDGGTTADGLPYFVMEFIDGLPITDYCDRHKLTIDARLTIFRTVCSAVHHAHQHLVIHRDLKPSNILVLEDGSPKLLDFGIAKVLNPETSNQNWLATQTGLRCMTPAYASPEQARGKSVSRETDVYSLGVVLYELLTGHRPYRLTQNSPAEIERAICEQEPEAPSTVIRRVENDTSPDGKPITKTPELVSLTRGGEPDKLRRRLRGDLDNIVLKSLQKEPKCRYGSVAEFSQDIDRHLQHQTVKARPRTFAYRVSKFVRRHRTEVSAAFAVVLATFAAASFAFNPAGIRNRLGIGSSQAKIRSSAVIPVVNISGDPSQEYASSVQHRPLNLNAWDAYLQGNYYLKKEDAAMGARDEERRKAGEFFQHAIDADPAFVSAYIGLAEAHHNLWWSSSEDLAIMRAAAAKALELAPTSSDAHLEAAVTKWEEWDWIGAEEESRRAVGLNANNAEAHQTLGYALDSMGQVDEAWKEYEIAQQLAPNQDHFSWPLLRHGQYDRSIELVRPLAEAHPGWGDYRLLLSIAYAQKGMHAASVQELGRFLRLCGLPETATRVDRAFANTGWKGALLQWAKELERLMVRKEAYLPDLLAQIYVLLGDKDRAFYWLEQGNEHRHLAIADPVLQFVKVDASFAPLHSDPRFKVLLHHMGLPE